MWGGAQSMQDFCFKIVQVSETGKVRRDAGGSVCARRGGDGGSSAERARGQSGRHKGTRACRSTRPARCAGVVGRDYLR